MCRGYPTNTIILFSFRYLGWVRARWTVYTMSREIRERRGAHMKCPSYRYINEVRKEKLSHFYTFMHGFTGRGKHDVMVSMEMDQSGLREIESCLAS
jgi:hypothetical protein